MTAAEFRKVLDNGKIGEMEVAKRLQVPPHDIFRYTVCADDVTIPPLVVFATLWIIHAEQVETFFSGN